MVPIRLLFPDGPAQSGGDQHVRTQPVAFQPEGGIPWQVGGGLLGRFLGGTPNLQQPQYQSFNPFGSPSAMMFDQYMNQAMGPSPFRFQSPLLQPISTPERWYQQTQSRPGLFGRPFANLLLNNGLITRDGVIDGVIGGGQ